MSGARLSLEGGAIMARMRGCTIRLLDFTRPDCGGTGVGVALGERYFLATAEHVIPVDHDIRLLVRGCGDVKVEFASSCRSKDDDVALLELERSLAESIACEFVSADGMALELDQYARVPVTVLGYPGQLINTTEFEGINADEWVQAHECRTLTFVSETMPTSEWPGGELCRHRAMLGRDLFVYFEPETTMQKMNLRLAEPPLEAIDFDKVLLDGMSGGGIWLEHAESRGVWYASPKLLGIQVSYLPSAGWLRGTPIARVLDLAWDNYPDLRDTIDALRSRGEA